MTVFALVGVITFVNSLTLFGAQLEGAATLVVPRIAELLAALGLQPKLAELERRYDSRHHASPATAAHNAALVDELGLVDFVWKWAPNGNSFVCRKPIRLGGS